MAQGDDVLLSAGEADRLGIEYRGGKRLSIGSTPLWLVVLNSVTVAGRTRLGTQAGVVPSIEQRARYRRDGAYAASLCTKAVDLLFAATGGAAIYQRNPIQRAFRDVHAANAHYHLNWDVNGAIYGRVALGLPPDAPL